MFKKLIMNCKEIQNKLIFYIDSELKPDESEIIYLHLQGCKECQYLYNQLKASYEFIEKDKQIELNPFFVTRVMEGLARKSKQNSIFNWFKIREYSIQVSVYSILIVLAIFVGHYLGKDKIVVDPVLVSQETEVIDNQLFAESYQIQINEEDVYLINGEDNAE